MMVRTKHTSVATLALLVALTGFPKFGAASFATPALAHTFPETPEAQGRDASASLAEEPPVWLSSGRPENQLVATATTSETGTSTANQPRNQGNWLWLLLLLPIALLAWWWLKGRRSDKSSDTNVTRSPSSASTPIAGNTHSSTATDGSPTIPQTASTDLATPPEPSLADRVSSVISADRAAINPNASKRGDLAEVVTSSEGAALPTIEPPPLTSSSGDRDQTTIEAAKFDVGQRDLSAEDLADVDQGLADLPDGYGDSRIVLLPRDPQWAYVYWDVPNTHKEELRRQGGERLALRFYDVTDIDLNVQNPHSLQQFECDEMARSWYIPASVSDRDYVAEIGYVAGDGRWLMLARSAPARIPPVYPSEWFDEQFVTIDWEDDLRGKTVLSLEQPPARSSQPLTENPLYEEMFDLVQSVETQRVAGSLYGSVQLTPEQAISSYVFPSGVGMWALPTMSMSGMGMSGMGFSASVPSLRPRKFWLVADAELIVYGATEPDATVTIGGQPIALNPDGTFRFQMSFQDGLIDYPIVAIAADGEQSRDVHMEFVRETPDRQTNTKDEATDEWL